MQPNITSIPIEEIFSETEGCAFCRMQRMLENQYVEHITGAAMMAPDVRVQTNQVGFCHRHFSMMINNGPRLSNALLLQTHINELRKKVLPKKATDIADKNMLVTIRANAQSCYVCDRIERDMVHLLAIVFKHYSDDPDFRPLYEKQDFLCLNHYALVMGSVSKKVIDKKVLPRFCEVTNHLSKDYMDTLYDDVTHFTTMYDYRNRGGDYKNSKDSIERSVRFLTSYEVDKSLK